MTDADEQAAFPVLDRETMEGLALCPETTRETWRAGDVIVEAGARDFRFHVVRRGEVEILDVSGDEPASIRVHGPGEFTGDIVHLTGRVSPFRMVARQDCELLALTSVSLRQALNLHPELGDVILRAFMARRRIIRTSSRVTGLRIIGSRRSPETLRLRDFLARNRVLSTWLDLDEDPQARALLDRMGVDESETPVVAWRGEPLLLRPTDRELAEAVGLRPPIEAREYDLVVVGAGPAGLAAAVYGASEGLSTLVLERTAPGGQAGSSMRIDNYLGFPLGIRGDELAELAMLQAAKFGARLPVPTQVQRLSFDGRTNVLHLGNDGKGGELVRARCLVIATGADYKLLDVEGRERFEGRGVYYAATPNEAQLCRGAEVVVVGGGNSAGQAAVYLSREAKRVLLVVRGPDLDAGMSSYLARRVEQADGIEVLTGTETCRLSGDGQLAEVELRDRRTGATRSVATSALFSFVGATPRTGWLPPEIERDEKGFVRTGPTLASSPSWSLERQPYLLETSRPGVFAAGDVRAGSVKRVASAVGEGSAAVQLVHAYLGEA